MPITAEQALEVVQYLGYDPEKVESVDELKETFGKEYIRKDQAHTDDEISGKIFGRVNGSLRSLLKSNGKELELEAEWDKIDPADGIKLLAQTAKEQRAKFQKELEEARKGGKSDKALEEIQTRYEKEKAKTEQLVNQLEELDNKYKGLEKSIGEKERQAKLDAQWERAFGQLEFNEGVNKFAVDGFKQAAKSKFALDLDGEELVAMDAATKKPVANPNRAGHFLGLDDLVRKYAEEEKLIGGAPNKGTPVKKTLHLMGNDRTQTTNEPAKPVRTLHPGIAG